ncbi:MAG: tRNA (N(6)-L-threonylcarbamoyladenosine(37)-C(2))-methylthiotransferase MtaB [Candidatus Bipolaricaulota bacterium]|nr:tRNA (N(6)-L-threonylcarbamoyladenosine(37)-C(2))-methylthiotransferase MtaB [Candidatus Bipolaricaulota bacterium]
MTRPRVAILTFGCRVNQYETELMRTHLAETCELVDHAADVYILNGCSVTGLAEKKARQAVHRLRMSSPNAVVLVTGCLAESVARGMSTFDAADAVTGNGWKTRISEVVAQTLAGRRGIFPLAPLPPLDDETSAGSSSRIRVYLKVQDGCSGACTYCRAVQLRGTPRAKSVRAAVAEARRLIGAGFPEVVLTGVNLAEYSTPEGGLPELAQRLLALPGLVRLRLASINVTGVTDALLDAFAGDARLCPHFHVPLQSGDDAVLRAMRRPYTAADYRGMVARIRNRLPHATLGADVIVGFPGEDEAAFAATCRMIEDVGFANLHVFRFSPRSGTEAADLTGAVPESTKRDRALRLAFVWRPSRQRLLDAHVGKTEDVLTETQREGRFHGHTAGYLEAAFTSEEPVSVGVLCRVRITSASEDGLEGVHDRAHCAG